MKLEDKINSITELSGNNQQIIIRKFHIGIIHPIEAALLYKDGLVDQNIINRDILNPLMHQVNEDLSTIELINEHVCDKYISMSKIAIESDISIVAKDIKSGQTAIIIYEANSFIVADTAGAEHRSITEPMDEVGIKGPRDGFVENLQVNLSLVKRSLKDKNLKIENLIVGRRSQKDIALLYVDDIVDKDILDDIRNRLSLIDVDFIGASGEILQYIEKYPYSIFPQAYATQRPDVVQSNLLEGKIAIIVDGTPFVLTVPSLFIEFFQAAEDYYQRTIVSNFNRFIRIFATFIVVILPSIYLTLIMYNSELIPIRFIIPIVQSRLNIGVSPFLEILSMQVVIEILREGGLRLPTKIAQTLSVVGGFIIGDAALQARIVSPTTLVIVGVATIGTFIVPSYDMSITIRLLGFPLLFLVNYLGALGLIAGLYFLFVHLLSLDSFGVPYFPLDKYDDLKDMFIRAPLWKMNKRPESIPNNNPVRQTDFRNKFGGNKNEKSRK
ncbi:spore germination protein [Clostridium bowmanii]|uniref:spore germination protein n=1 Tax=Clostridium bowmanii TaxID=132925 RepID=UPI001C0C8DD9|nr:spore germination protein [Clostridium bowmanii]MBU3190210.1 spore germination protein [Clostridium bowmanii]MCA1074815.1 spore germination protein [Clostridium bowmanii]